MHLAVYHWESFSPFVHIVKKGGLVLEAHGLAYRSTLGSRVIKSNKEELSLYVLLDRSLRGRGSVLLIKVTLCGDIRAILPSPPRRKPAR
jgi:hypothetical protein